MADRFFGITFLLLGSLGYLCIAEDPRHLYEIVGVSAVFIAGAVLTVSGFHWLMVRPIMARAIAAGLLAGIVGGIMMQNVPMGVAVGLTLGALVGAGFLHARRHSNRTPGSADRPPDPNA